MAVAMIWLRRSALPRAFNRALPCPSVLRRTTAICSIPPTGHGFTEDRVFSIEVSAWEDALHTEEVAGAAPTTKTCVFIAFVSGRRRNLTRQFGAERSRKATLPTGKICGLCS